MGLAASSRKTMFATETTTSNSSKDQVSGGEDNLVGLSMKRCSESRKEAARGTFFLPGQLPKLVHRTCVLCTKQGSPPRLQQR